MSRSALEARRQLLVATACLQRTRLALDVQVLRRRGSAVAQHAPLLAGAALAAAIAGMAVAGASRRSGSGGTRSGRVEALVRLLDRSLALWPLVMRLWREGRARRPRSQEPP
jgi:hypothetical protein